jgi:ArsR family metal-binding transcriptional regulator
MNDTTAALRDGCYGIGQFDALARNRSGYRSPAEREINQAWENRAEITPSFEGAPKPQVLEILKLLPRTNCRECGEPTCMVFAARAAEGIKSATDCPPLTAEDLKRLENYLGRFNFDG